MLSDDSIVDLFLRRDETAISETSEKYGQRLLRRSFDILKDRQASEECVNDTYLRAWNSIPPNEPRAHLYAYLAKIARHLALNVCRERSALKRSTFLTELSDELEQCIPSPDDCESRLDEMAFSEMLNGFLNTLDDEKRNMFVRRYWYMDTVSEIAKRYSVSESKVKTTLFRCRNKMREYIEREGFVL